MRLQASCDIRITVPGDCPVVAMLRPRSGHAQWMIGERYELAPWVPTTEYVDSYGNLCQRFTVPAGEMRIRVESLMETEALIAVAPDASATPVAQLPDDVLRFLLQSRYCPSDMMAERALQIVGDAAPGYAQAEKIRQWIHANLAYRYGVSESSTDALDTLEHGAGVCRDFSHVGIALCRSLNLPARVVVGYLYRLDPMDMHAWYEVFIDGRWYTFDATQQEPRGGRIVVAYGRDAADVAFLSNYAEMRLTAMTVAVAEVDAAPAPARPAKQPAVKPAPRRAPPATSPAAGATRRAG